MKDKSIFPSEIVEFTSEYHFQQHTTRSRIVYLVVLFCLAGAFVALFFITVNVGVKGSGILTGSASRSWIKAPVSGRVEEIFVKENEQVEKGAVLFTVQSEILKQEFSYLDQRQLEIDRKLSDLRQLVRLCRNKDIDTPVSLISPLYTQQYSLFRQQVLSAGNYLQNVSSIFERNKSLHDSEVISAAEFDKYKYELEKARTDLGLAYGEQGSRWQTELNELSIELREMTSQRNKFNKEKEFYTVKAPMSGSVQGIEALRAGSFLSLGEDVAELSPDSGLIARVAISPKDIGLLKHGMRVRFQVNAFNYQQWGVVEGKITDIAKDVMLVQESQPVFEVKCQLDKTALELDNGYEGKLKKGMTLQARFVVTERTLFQLLYDNVGDWLNPNGKN